MRYLVTGGAGFIGSNLVDRLINDGHEVIVVDNLATGKQEYVNKKAKFYHLDIVDGEAIEPLFKDIDGVFHVAARARIQPSFEDPNLYFSSNAIGTRNVLMAAKKFGVKRVIYSSTSSAYGSDQPMPLNEDFKLEAQALNPYASTKRMGEMLMKDLGTLTGGPETVCLRYFNVYGPRQTASEFGSYAIMVGIFLDLLKKGMPLTIVPDGHQRRAFAWVGDVVEANVLAMNASQIGNAEIINIGAEKNYSVWDAAKMILQVPMETTEEELLKNNSCIMAPARRGEARETLADISKAKKLLGWEPKVSFSEGIKKLLQDLK